MIDIRVISDLETARDLWQQLSPGETIYDLWDFRYCFYKHDPQPLRFYAAYDGPQAVALLPLQYNENLECLEFLAENFMEDNRPFCAPGYEYLAETLLQQDFGQTAKLYDLRGDDPYTRSLPLEDYIYYLELEGLTDFSGYLKKYFPDSHKRSNFKRLFSLLEKRHQVEVVSDDFSDLETLMDLNVRRFGEESYLHSENERRPFFDLLKLPLDWRMATIVIDGVKAAGSLSVFYRGTYFYLVVGADNSLAADAFKYLTKVNLERAFADQARIFDCSLGDCNWKSHWHLERRPQFKLVKEVDKNS